MQIGIQGREQRPFMLFYSCIQLLQLGAAKGDVLGGMAGKIIALGLLECQYIEHSVDCMSNAVGVSLTRYIGKSWVTGPGTAIL